MTKLTILITSMLLSSLANAASYDVGGGYLFTSDSDSSDTRYIYTEAGMKLNSSRAFVQIGQKTFEDAAGKADFDVALVGLTTKWNDKVQTTFTAGQLQGNAWSPVIGSANVAVSMTDKFRVEGFYERGVIDSVVVLPTKTTTDTYGISADYDLTETLTAVGSVFKVDISDGASKTGYSAKLVYTPMNLGGLNLQLKYKELNGDVPNGNVPLYFIADEDKRAFLTVGYNKAITESVVFKAYAGAGQRTVNGDSNKAIEYGVKLTTVVNDSAKINLTYECTKDYGNPKYEYCWGGATVSVTF